MLDGTQDKWLVGTGPVEVALGQMSPWQEPKDLKHLTPFKTIQLIDSESR